MSEVSESACEMSEHASEVSPRMEWAREWSLRMELWCLDVIIVFIFYLVDDENLSIKRIQFIYGENHVFIDSV